MLQFDNITVVKKANIYYDGSVTSRTVIFPTGEKKTLGIMLQGNYEFSTNDKEIMEVLGGTMDVMLPNSEKYITYCEGERFEVPKNSSFKLIIKEPVDYCCSYISE